MAATLTVILEPHKLDREYAQPFTREVHIGDTLVFKAEGANFQIIIPNQDGFLTLVNGTSAGDPINKTINDTYTESFKVAASSSGALTKYYNVCWISTGQYADRVSESPPKIIIVP